MSRSRREFLKTASFAGGALVVLPALPALMVRNDPVLSFHMDQPYVDASGLGKPYRPPAGARGGALLAAFSEQDLSRYYGLI